ncbi:MAG: glutamate-5-semialdehyde dehydrogenase [Chloroflexi bacterium]|nr:glutamate-5-semialdehyde dehydrogenase [Chloroflexota bacterium]
MIELHATITIRQLAERARDAAVALRSCTPEQKTRAIQAMARGLIEQQDRILEANARDVAAAKANGMGSAKVDRLTLTEARLRDMAAGLESVAALPDPIGKAFSEMTVESGLHVERVRVPLGVILFIYEARPNTTADAAAICLKASNAIILRGGSEAKESNGAIVAVLSEGLTSEGLPADAIQTVPFYDHASVNELLGLSDLIDLVIPRGGEALIRTVAQHSTIPVLKHYKGVCYVYVDETADLDMAEEIVFNSKVQRPAVCNASEHLLVHQSVAAQFLPRVAQRLNMVELRGDDASRQVVPTMHAASEADWSEEYLDLIMGVKVVSGVGEAIDHINRYSSHHTDTIVSADEAAARRFLHEVDSASVLWNASTRMADGGQVGLGAEIGISTDKLHARGPMGVEELTSYKWVLIGNGQIRK